MTMRQLSGYAAIFAACQPGYDPRHIEAFVRVEHPTLDHLTRGQLEAEARVAAACVDEVGADGAERIARSFGLMPMES